MCSRTGLSVNLGKDKLLYSKITQLNSFHLPPQKEQEDDEPKKPSWLSALKKQREANRQAALEREKQNEQQKADPQLRRLNLRKTKTVPEQDEGDDGLDFRSLLKPRSKDQEDSSPEVKRSFGANRQRAKSEPAPPPPSLSTKGKSLERSKKTSMLEKGESLSRQGSQKRKSVTFDDGEKPEEKEEAASGSEEEKEENPEEEEKVEEEPEKIDPAQQQVTLRTSLW